MTGKNFFSFFLKFLIVVAGFLFITLENQVRFQGVDTVVRKGLAAAENALGAVATLFGTLDADQEQNADPVTASDRLAASESAAPPPSGQASPGGIAGTPLTAASPVQMATNAPPVEAALCNEGSGRAEGVVPGDILRLRHFEKSTVAAGRDDVADKADIVFERLDLSGTFTVGTDGALSLPAIGHIQVLGLSLPCIEAMVARTARDRLRIDSMVNANFVARPQISLEGAVRAPGTYSFTPGLTVARLLAQAGSLGGDDAASRARRVELEARASELQAMAQGMFLVQNRLEAALDDKASVDGIATEVADAGPILDPNLAPNLAQDRIRAEQMALEAERDAVQSLREKQRTELRTLDLRIESAERQLEALTRQHAYFSERNERLSGLLSKGVTTSDALEISHIRVMDTEYARLEKAELVKHLKAQREVLQRSFELVAADWRKAKIDALRDVIASRNALEGQVATVVAQLGTVGGGQGRTIVTIERTGPDGTTRIRATAGTEILPGDFVSVILTHDDPISRGGGDPDEVDISRIESDLRDGAQEPVIQ